MKIYSRYDQMSKERFDAWTRRYTSVTPSYEKHPREDHHLISAKYPIFVVADGVTLKRDAEGAYPVPSGAFELSKMFCEKIIEEAEKIYEDFTEENLRELFAKGNNVARQFNELQGRTKDTIDYREHDLFAATSSFVLIKRDVAYWWSICDSGIAVFNGDGRQKFQSPEAWLDEKEKIATLGDEPLTDTEFNKLKKKTFRNTIDEQGDKIGYGVVTGEENALHYLNTGSFTIDTEDLVFVYTDGYENYISLPEFRDVFIKWSDSLESDFNQFLARKGQENSDLYGREKTLIAIKM